MKGPTPVSVLVALGAMTEVKGSTPVQGIGGIWGGGMTEVKGIKYRETVTLLASLFPH